jgi:hypothetical protein
MGDRFYTTVEVSGPNADAAAKSAMEAFIVHDSVERGSWVDGDDPFAPCYYSKGDSGDGAIVIVTEVSRKSPEATFHLYVNGSCGEGVQGPVLIQNGSVTDGRTEECSDGGPYDTPTPEYITALAPFKEPVPKDAVLVRMSPEQLVPYLKEQIRELREMLKEREERVDELEEKYLPPIDMAKILGQ